MGRPLTAAQRLKFALLADGMRITQAALARLQEQADDRALTPADFASTTGVILALEDDVWVNAPIPAHNPNFVDATPYVLDVDGDGFMVRGDGLRSAARVWLPPSYHDRVTVAGRPIDHFVLTHGDRARLSPIRGCSMRCRFCNIPYEDPYELKPPEAMVPAIEHAVADPLQPAHHVLISGGTPAARDIPYLQGVYRTVLKAFPDLDIDIMMVPVEGLLDLEELRDLGVNELSINLELASEEAARSIMPQKHRFGWSSYLSFIERATGVLGPGRVRSMLMVGLEPTVDTLAGVRAVLEHGGVPVLSPFRPDPATPLANLRPASAREFEEVFLAAEELAGAVGVPLGPSCVPCTHNTMTLAPAGGSAVYRYPRPALV